MALHGNGDTAENFYDTALDQINVPARIILLKGPLSSGRGNAWPWTEAEFDQYGTAVKEAIALLVQKFPTIDKPILLGFSGGAMMAYYQAIKQGDNYSYIFPISGRMSKDLFGDGSVISGAEVYAYHGKKDRVVSYSGGKTAVKILQENGIFVQFTEFNGGHLGIFTDMKEAISQHIEEKIDSLDY